MAHILHCSFLSLHACSSYVMLNPSDCSYVAVQDDALWKWLNTNYFNNEPMCLWSNRKQTKNKQIKLVDYLLFMADYWCCGKISKCEHYFLFLKSVYCYKSVNIYKMSEDVCLNFSFRPNLWLNMHYFKLSAVYHSLSAISAGHWISVAFDVCHSKVYIWQLRSYCEFFS